MGIKQRIARAERAINRDGDIKLIWIEPDESGDFPPPGPGETVIALKWVEGEPDPAEWAEQPAQEG